jgi:hypothetical protein
VHPGGWTAWFERDPRSPWGGSSFSLATEPDGRFRVSLSKAERAMLTKNAQGMVEVYSHNPRIRIELPFEQLSLDPEKPFQIRLTRPVAR